MIKDYFKPSSLEEALDYKKKNPGAFYLGGGTKLNKTGEDFYAESYISLENLDLDGISLEGGVLKIGSMVTLQKLMDSEDVPLFLKESAAGESNRNIRNASTVGGEIAYCHSSSTVVTGLLALEAEVETAEGATKTLEQYISGKREELIKGIVLPSSKAVLVQRDKRVTSNCRPELSVAVSILKDKEKVQKAVLVMGGIGEIPVRLKNVEKRLIDGSLASADSVQDAVQDELVPFTEKHERGTYLNYIGGVLAADTVGRAMR